MQQYSVNHWTVSQILNYVSSDEIALPEIQRPFVWDSIKVRDLIDSLYRGYPIGYLITWKNPNIRLKNGGVAEGKKILIDGQQRIAALTVAVLGNTVVDKSYKKIHIRIAFNPVEERFEAQNPAILKDKRWVHDISQSLSPGASQMKLIKEYLHLNPECSEEKIESAFHRLSNIWRCEVGHIELASELDIDKVTDIFIRINSKGAPLNQADFAMSKIAADTENGGNVLRKAIDYFCHLAVSPEFYQQIYENDKEFAKTDYFKKMKWLKNENDDLYDPTFADLIRVAFTSQFDRGRLADLVSLLSGRNFETRNYEESIVKATFALLGKGVEQFINENNFKSMLMIIRSTGLISPRLIHSKGVLNVLYALYLKLKSQNANRSKIERFIRRWFVYSLLTSRYSGTTETTVDSDIRNIDKNTFETYLEEREQADLSDAFWQVGLPQNLNTTSTISPLFGVFLASQVHSKDKGFLSKEITVSDLISLRGDLHHLFPKEYLKKNGRTRGEYNQIANFAYMQSEINIKIGCRPPKDYIDLVKKQMTGKGDPICEITSPKKLNENFEMHCIPPNFSEMTNEDYEAFLVDRRKLIAKKMQRYYFSL